MGMTAEELWKRSGLTGMYEVWAFGEAPDKLASLVKEECTALFLIHMMKRSASFVRKRYMLLNSIRLPKNTHGEREKGIVPSSIGERSTKIS